MLDVKNPEIRVEDIMQRIQETIRLRREAGPTSDGKSLPALESGVPAESTLVIRQHLMHARQFADIGVVVPSMTRTSGIKRLIAGFIAKVFLRVAQLITRDQRLFNLELLSAMQALLDRNAHAEQAAERASREATRVSRQVEELEARLRAAEAKAHP